MIVDSDFTSQSEIKFNIVMILFLFLTFKSYKKWIEKVIMLCLDFDFKSYLKKMILYFFLKVTHDVCGFTFNMSGTFYFLPCPREE